MLQVAAEDLDDALALTPPPLEERERPDDLQSDFPLVAIGERSDEEALVGLYALGHLVGELFEQVQRAHRDEPILV
jgi:hypothetical protein